MCFMEVLFVNTYRYRIFLSYIDFLILEDRSLIYSMLLPYRDMIYKKHINKIFRMNDDDNDQHNPCGLFDVVAAL